MQLQRLTPTAITYKGVAKTTMAVRYEGVTRTHVWKPLTVVQSLPIGRAGSCKAEGRSTVKGVTFRWSALLKGVGTCRT